MQAAKAAGGGTPGPLCCFATQGAETQPPSLCNGAGFPPGTELERAQAEQPEAFQARDE